MEGYAVSGPRLHGSLHDKAPDITARAVTEGRRSQTPCLEKSLLVP